MDRERPPLEPPPGRDWVAEEDYPYRRHYSPAIIFGIAVFAVIAFYLGLVAVSQARPIFFPGNPVPGLSILPKLPGCSDCGGQPGYAEDINDRINILVLGLDQRRDEPDGQPYRTDSVMIMTLDPYSKTGGAFSIPRDTVVDIPDGEGGYTRDRINVVYEMGQFTYRSYPDGGVGLVKDTIEKNFDIPIDYSVILNFNNFIELIDALDGVDVQIPEYAYDPAYSDCNRCRTYPVEFDPGTEHMDGARALAYARIRHSDNDFKRIERQQQVLRALAKKAAGLDWIWSDPLGVYSRYKDAVKTDIGDVKIPGLALLAKQIGPDKIRMVSMAPATYPCGSSCTGAVLLWNKDKMEQLKALVFNDGRLQSENAHVQVLNGTPTPDLGADFASFLRGQGLSSDRISVDEDPGGQLYDNTIIIDVSGKNYTATQLAKWLELPDAKVIDGTDPTVTPYADSTADVIVVLGSDVQIPTSVLTQAGG